MPQTLAEIRSMLDAYGLCPRKRFGQNFLIDHNLVRKLVDEAQVTSGSLVLEVGPGTGTLTEELLERGCGVVACELDRGLARLLHDRLGDRAGFTLIEGDCLAHKHEVSAEIIAALDGQPFTLVANLPYGAATPLMLALLTTHPACTGMFVTIQKEVGDRLGARTGQGSYGSLSVVTQSLATVRPLAKLPPDCFWPRPEITSVMVAVERLTDHGIEDPVAFGAFCQRVFAQRRKQLGRVLGRNSAWPEGIEPWMRAEQLEPSQIEALWRVVR